MAREKFQTLTEQMFYILMCLRKECCGMDIMAEVDKSTGGRVSIGPGTLYNLLEQFTTAQIIEETKSEGRRKNYILTEKGREILESEYHRLGILRDDYKRLMEGEERNGKV